LEQGKVLFELVKIWRFLNPFESVNIVESISNRTAATVLAGPSYRCPATALPRSPLSLPHPAADIRPSTRPGPTCQPRPHRVGCAPPLSPVARQHCRLRSTVEGRCCPPCAADHHARGPLSSFSLCHASAPTGPPSFFPRCPAPPRCLKSHRPPPAPSFRRCPLDRARA
jgi:hypothetical protein